MSSFTSKISIAALSFLALQSSAYASIVSANFTESLDLPQYGVGPRLVQRIGVTLPQSGALLTSAFEVSNPSGWGNMLDVGFNAATNQLSFTGNGSNVYQTITFVLSSIVFSGVNEQITGVSAMTTNQAVTGTYNISTAFTTNSATVTYSVADLSSDSVFDIKKGTDLFQLQTSTATGVPEPTSLALVGLALACGALVRRKA